MLKTYASENRNEIKYSRLIRRIWMMNVVYCMNVVSEIWWFQEQCIGLLVRRDPPTGWTVRSDCMDGRCKEMWTGNKNFALHSPKSERLGWERSLRASSSFEGVARIHATEQHVDLLQVDLLASGASLFWPRSGRPRPRHMTTPYEIRRRTFWKSKPQMKGGVSAEGRRSLTCSLVAGV